MTDNSRAGSDKLLRIIGKYLIIALGSFVFAAGFQFFMYPNSLSSGGATGIAMILNALTGLPVGTTTIILNIPLFIIAWKTFGLQFIISSFVGMVLSSAFVDLLALTGFAATNDPMLACIIGGAIKGAGLGCVYLVGATTGGTDIVAKLVRRRAPHLNLGTVLLLLDTVIILLYALILGNFESAMYSIIAMFVVSKVIDLVLYGIDNSSICYIISDRSDELARQITTGKLHRGCTILDGKGAYSGDERKMIMCVIKRHQISELRKIIKNTDEKAFFIVTDAKSVVGEGFESIKEEG